MALDQELSFALVAGTVGCFVWGRLPCDLVSVAALLVGVVPAHKAFEGFSDEGVIIIATALVVSAGIARSGIVEAAMRPITPRLPTVGVQVPVLVGLVMALPRASKNVGAPAILMPAAMQLARRTGTSPSSLLMPMASASMPGGLVTLVGTSPNILIAKVRAEVEGRPLTMFDFTPGGLSIAVLGAAFLALGWRLPPRGRRPRPRRRSPWRTTPTRPGSGRAPRRAGAACRRWRRWRRATWPWRWCCASGSAGCPRTRTWCCGRTTCCCCAASPRTWSGWWRGRGWCWPAACRGRRCWSRAW